MVTNGTTPNLASVNENIRHIFFESDHSGPLESHSHVLIGDTDVALKVCTQNSSLNHIIEALASIGVSLSVILGGL